MSHLTPLSVNDQELIEKHFPGNFSQSQATVRDILKRLGRPLCENRAKNDPDHFELVRRFQVTRGARMKARTKRANEAK